jgi:hypothetical protein
MLRPYMFGVKCGGIVRIQGVEIGGGVWVGCDLNPAVLGTTAATGWLTDQEWQDAVAGRSPSGLRINEPRPYEKGKMAT